MALLLSSYNVAQYLRDVELCTNRELDLFHVDSVAAKNFNLLVTLSNSYKYLVKQERCASDGKAAGKFLNEWRIQELLQLFPELDSFRSLLPVVSHFDAENSIIVFNYLDACCDLTDFYVKENVFPSPIAFSISTITDTIHRSTFNRQNYQ